MSTYTAAVLADSPVSYWRFDETSGTNAADQQGANAGTYTGTFTLGQPSLLAADPDFAVLLSAGYVNVSGYLPFAAGSQRTFECWAQTAGGFAGNVPLFGGPVGTSPILWFDTAVNMGFYPANSTEAAWAGAWPGNNVPVHVVLTFDDTAKQAELFINGASLGAKAAGASYSSPGALRIGTYETGIVFFGGVVDEFAVYNGLLSASRIAAHYAAAQPQVARVYGRFLPRRVSPQ